MQRHDLDHIASCDAALELGRGYLASGDRVNARRCFEMAHALGHENVREHIRAHLALLGVALRERDLQELVLHLYSVVTLHLLGRFFFRGRAAAKSRRRT
jgi:hypothetical protein